MKLKSLNYKRIELLIYVFVWIFILSVPYINERVSGSINLERLLPTLLVMTVFMTIFFANVYIFIPKLLFKKKYIVYIVLIISIWLLLVSLGDFLKLPPPPPPGNIEKLNPIIPTKPIFVVFMDHLLIILLIFGSGAVGKLTSKWLNEEKLRKDIEKENFRTNLALLRNQVSPHFFMNTLNNIHALIDIDKEDAKDAIIRLSTLMRYLLYDSSRGNIELKKEIDFIKSFISLMKLRYSEKVKIDVVIPEIIPEIKIPPMMFISFLENAFKHGISYQSESFIFFKLKVSENTLSCVIINSKHQNMKIKESEYSGIGLENIKKSLNLMYSDTYNLTIEDNKTEFKVNLTIPL